MARDELQATNQRLHDLERKLSLTLSSSLTYTAASHGLVVQNPAHSGLARQNIQLSVIQYIRDSQPGFDAGRVFTDRQQRHATAFAREYSPAGGSPYTDYFDADPSEGREARGPDRKSYYGQDRTDDVSGNPREHYGQDINEHYGQDINEHYGQDPNDDLHRNPNEHYGQDINEHYGQDPNDDLDRNPKEYYGQDINEYYGQDPNDDLDRNPKEHYGRDINEYYGQDANEQDGQDPNDDLDRNPKEYYGQDPNEHYGQDPNDHSDLDLHKGFDRNPNDDVGGSLNMNLDQHPDQHLASGDGFGTHSSADDDMLLPPLPPRLPPRELDPSKLYGLFDFLGPDPLHCTLRRDEPVYLLNDLDKYWWLIKKLSTQERQLLPRGQASPHDALAAHDDGKIGFVPAECLETHGERLARLNCFRNEELERSSRDTLPALGAVSRVSLDESIDGRGLGALQRSSSILKKAGTYVQSNKLVTFENLGDLRLDDEDSDLDDVMDFSDNYYSVGHADVAGRAADSPEEPSDVLSDTYPPDAPLQIRKPRATAFPASSDLADFAQPRLLFSGDNTSIGSFSPDTPPAKHAVHVARPNSADGDEGEHCLRRSLIIDRLNIVTLGMDSQAAQTAAAAHEPTFGGSLSLRAHSDDDSEGSMYEPSPPDRPTRALNRALSGIAYGDNEGLNDQISRKSLLAEDFNTPLTSVNSVNCVSTSPKPPAPVAREKRRKRPVYDMFLPILGQLDELTEKLAELEHTL
ncbi:hypothetical protein METBIDRAFT_81680 [Metschnikowia bicuspidata var. bicuspidata NRRL YB-4993]|uniref:SH3 domain-containing protein n=1 Tax=Metschnikowia bicuspidata var. bicuspidata NRRL YB-4993 TaxID=869754 RepID=A0A1A0HJP7_9ASCO|nr:hypothetical protein METBIDRAFT_81680 [Metschnikowia bicuspidata var. bicuspidata NRRL YB-4993]OBA24394.1 hypothetical protein METBIDRAFT_81680 [Metschnikowia bicuspidata var. bicuspidata NRRL YB-4993]